MARASLLPRPLLLLLLALVAPAAAPSVEAGPRRFPADRPIDVTHLKLECAVDLEKKSVLFYLGMKDMVPQKLGRDRLDHIISEEKGHIVELSRELRAVQDG